jgi:antitoxin (DNA-binding transcriptional repressor) of toxin-antitoxin stability system
MSDTQTISATKARNNFFQLLDQALLENKTFIIKKGSIPVANITPPQKTTSTKTNKQKKQLKLLKDIEKFRKTLPFQKESSVKLIHKMREERMNKFVKQ